MAKVYVHGDEVAAIKPFGPKKTMHIAEENIRALVRKSFGKRHGVIYLGTTKIGVDENGAYVQYDI